MMNNSEQLTVNSQQSKGMSLLEVLVVMAVFAVLGILVTQSIALTLRGSQKSESLVRTRENLSYSLSIIERQIRGAKSITCPNTPVNITYISYLDQNSNSGRFSCVNTGSVNSYIASGSAMYTAVHLTSDAVKIMACSFNCTPGTAFSPALVKVDLTVQDAKTSGIQSANVSASTQIYLRNY